MADSDAFLQNLPKVITGNLEARREGDLEAALRGFALDATVVDEGMTHEGMEVIRSWMSRSATEYTYTVEPVALVRTNHDQYDVLQHLEGNFPGGQIDLHFRFTLREGQSRGSSSSPRRSYFCPTNIPVLRTGDHRHCEVGV
jgi:hypothetical protein